MQKIHNLQHFRIRSIENVHLFVIGLEFDVVREQKKNEILN